MNVLKPYIWQGSSLHRGTNGIACNMVSMDPLIGPYRDALLRNLEKFASRMFGFSERWRFEVQFEMNPHVLVLDVTYVRTLGERFKPVLVFDFCVPKRILMEYFGLNGNGKHNFNLELYIFLHDLFFHRLCEEMDVSMGVVKSRNGSGYFSNFSSELNQAGKYNTFPISLKDSNTGSSGFALGTFLLSDSQYVP